MMYTGLADVYDFFAYDFDYDAWTELYEELLKSKRGAIKEICDCGCGTGSLSVRLAGKGYKITGIDISGDMLRVASDKARKEGVFIPFVKQDMRLLSLPHKTDALMCACDGVNYLTELKGVSAFFAAAYANLKPGGALAFDISNEYKLSEMGRVGLYGEDTGDRAYLWQNKYDPDIRLIRMDLSFFVRGEDGRYDKLTETHIQRAHRAQELTDLLAKAGFTDITLRGSDLDTSKRIYFAAKKPE